jgi:hypothetical protein
MKSKENSNKKKDPKKPANQVSTPNYPQPRSCK